MHEFLKLTMPFSILGIAFLIIGYFKNEIFYVHFGIVWFVIALIAMVIRLSRNAKRN